MAALVQDVSARMGRTEADVLDLLMFRLEALLKKKRLQELGIEWTDSPVIQDPVTDTPDIKFDVSLLERSARGKTGFSGVYATSGSTFRALVPDPTTGGAKYLASRPTAILAAIDRFRWYEDHGLPYGNIARYVEHYQGLHVGCSVEEALITALDFGDQPLKHPFTKAQAIRALESYRAKHKIAAPKSKSVWEQVEEVRSREGKAEEPEQEQDNECPVCSEPLRDHEPKGFIRDSLTVAHVRCLDQMGRPMEVAEVEDEDEDDDFSVS